MGEKETALPAQVLGNYQVRAKIGSGGMGDVYDAIHTGLNKRVAIKTLRKRFLDDDIVVQRFLREGQLASRIRHPNIVDVTDVGMMGGLPCLVMEHLEGESFSGLIRREGRLSVERIVDILLPIIAAVDFAHDHGVVHRDLKPSNIFLARSWNGEMVSKVLDFGISKLIHEAQEAALTTDSAFVGTPHYASPESMRADRQADGRSDQYSMGVILYEAVTGVRPFADLGNNFVALAMAICKGEYPPARNRNPEIPVAFDNVIKRAMSLSTEDRFLTMRAMGEALMPFASERARMIWNPTFQSGEIPALGEFRNGNNGNVGPASATIATPASINSRRVPLPPLSASTGPHQSLHPSSQGQVRTFTGPMPYVETPSTTPPGAAFDRVPTYGGTAGSYGSNPRPLPQQKSSGVVLGVIGASVVVAMLAGALVLKGGIMGGKHDKTTNATSATAPAPTTYAVDVAVTPASATVELDGVPTGASRLVQTMPKDGRKHVIRASAPQYESVLINFDDLTPPPATIALRPTAPTQPTSRSPGGQPQQPYNGGNKGNPNTGKKGSNQPRTDNIDPWDDNK